MGLMHYECSNCTIIHVIQFLLLDVEKEPLCQYVQLFISVQVRLTPMTHYHLNQKSRCPTAWCCVRHTSQADHQKEDFYLP